MSKNHLSVGEIFRAHLARTPGIEAMLSSSSLADVARVAVARIELDELAADCASDDDAANDTAPTVACRPAAA